MELELWVNIFNHVMKTNIQSSCEIEDFVETHLCKLCVIIRSHVLLDVCALVKNTGWRLPLELQCSHQGQRGDVRQSVRRNYETCS